MKRVRTILIAVCAMLMLGTFAAAQNGDWNQGGGWDQGQDQGRGWDRDQGRGHWGERGYGDRYRSALSDLHAANDLLMRFNPDDPNIKQAYQDIQYAINEMNGATGIIGSSGANLPLAAPVRGRDPWNRISQLLDRAYAKLTNAPEPNPRARVNVDKSIQMVQEAQQLVEYLSENRSYWGY